jgi:cytochrome c biogenesis protein CcdA
MLAGGAGLLSFVSPCVLPLLPSYLSYISGLSTDQLMARQDAATCALLGHSLGVRVRPVHCVRAFRCLGELYALGLGLPFVLAGPALDRFLRVTRALLPRLQAIEVCSGVL